MSTQPKLPRTLGKMTTSVQKTFRRTPEGFYLEVDMHFIQFLNEDGSLRSQKLDYERHLDLWRIARDGERSPYGELMWMVPEHERPVRLICIKKG